MAFTNIAVKNTSGRQWPLYALIDVPFSAVGADGLAVGNIFKLPPNAIVIDGAIDVITASDATTATLDIGDSLNATRYAAGVNLKAAGRTAMTLTDYVGNGIDIILTPHVTGTPTVGTFRMFIGYLIKDRATEAQTN